MRRPNRLNRHLIRLALIIAVAFLLAGCAAPWQSAKTDYTPLVRQTKEIEWPDKHMKQRFARYWGLRYEGDPAQTFEMEAPHIQVMAPRPRYEFFVEQTAVNKLAGIEVVDLLKESDYLYEVHFYLDMKTRRGEAKRMFLKDRWVEVDGKWYHIFRNPILFPKLT